MSKITKKIIEKISKYNNLIKQNKDSVYYKNKEMIEVFLACSIIIMLFILVAVFIFNESIYVKAVYIVAIVLFSSMFVVLRFDKIHHIMLHIDIVYLLTILYSVFTSIHVSFNYMCVTAFIFIFLFSVLFIDYDIRIIIMTYIGSLIYLITISNYKTSTVGVDEIINVLLFLLIASISGVFIRHSQIESIANKRSFEVMAFFDQLTGMANRRALFEFLDENEKNGNQSHISGFAMIDIDSFKQYNDAFGHRAGDECLRKIGACFAKYENQYNIKFYRYGGEEFVAVNCDYSDSRFLEICESVRKSVEKTRIENDDGSVLYVTVSVGVSFVEGKNRKYDAFLSDADSALYMAKSRGKNRVEKYEQCMSRSEVKS